MAWKALRSLEFSDDEKLDRMIGPEPKAMDYPMGMQFCISEDDLEKADAEDGDPGDTMRFAAMTTVTNIFRSRDGCSINLEMTEFAGEDGKFFPLSNPTSLCLTDAELEKLGLEPNCERGDTLHLMGTARLEHTSSTEGGDMCCLQITEMTFEDESTESRDAG